MTASQRSEEIRAYARWLTQACQQAGLNAEQYGRTVLVMASDHHLSERVTCGPDDQGRLRWWWSWGRPIADLRDPGRSLTADDVDDLVTAIAHVVRIEVPRS